MSTKNPLDKLFATSVSPLQARRAAYENRNMRDLAYAQDLKRNAGGIMAPPIPGAPSSPNDGLVMPHRSMTGLQANQRSNTIQIHWATDDNNSGATIVRPVLQFTGTTEETDILSIMLGGPTFVTPTDTNALTPSGFAKCSAALAWGVGNVQFATTIDWVLGTVICLPANFLSVTARVGPGGNTIPVQPDLLLGVAVAYGAVPGHKNRCHQTVEVGPLNNNAVSSPIPIPPFAVGFTVISSGGKGAPFFAQGPALNIRLRDNTATNSWWDYAYASSSNLGIQDTATFPIPNGARELAIGNNSGTGASNITVIFEIGF